jgi:uncharacterized protein (TIGR02145 family)
MFGIADNSGDTDTHKFLYLPVKNLVTGRTWLNNNLGAQYADVTSKNFNPAQQATASNDYKAYGSLFQWGRKADGHELINWTDGETGEAKHGVRGNVSDEPEDTSFRTSAYVWVDHYYGRYNLRDWRINTDDSLWANELSANNVCPAGYRLPTTGSDGTNKEWAVEKKSWNIDGERNEDGDFIDEVVTSVDALASTLKLPMSGYRDRDDGGIVYEGTTGYYWSASANISTTTGIHYIFALLFNNEKVSTDNSNKRRWGFNVRCIKNE